MSKLIKFKEWLTIDEAANYLKIGFGESVTSADILRLSLDGHLKVSVNFVNHGKARRGTRVSINDAKKTIIPPLKDDGNEIEIMRGLKLYNSVTNVFDEVVQFDNEVVTITGVWDLTMLGGERLDVEHEFQQLTNGVGVELVNIDGCYVEEPTSGAIYELQDSFDDNEYTRGSLAELEKIKTHIKLESIDKQKANLLLNQHKENRKLYLEKRLKDRLSDYYPAGGLPENSVLVVRTQAIAEFIDAANPDKKPYQPLPKNIEAINKTEIPTHLSVFDIGFWLRLDTWTKEQAAFLFCNIVPDTFIRDKFGTQTFMDFKSGFYSSEGKGDGGVDGFFELYHSYESCLKLIEGINYFSKSPSEWIERANIKNIPIVWLEFAIKEGLYVLKKDEAVKQITERPLSNIERETLLIIIAALAKEAKIDINKTSKAGELIAKLSQQVGAPVGPTTIETHLKKISQALENRAK